MSERVPVRLPERIFLRRVDVNDLDWDGAEGDVHCLYSPNTIIATHMDAFIPEARHKELMERAVGEANSDALVLLEMIDKSNIIVKDWACANCVAREQLSADMVIAGFQCAYHRVKARAASSPGEKEGK